jgi:hypothetical protein
MSPTTLRLGQFIETYLAPLLGEKVFEDRNSAQYRAAEYLADEDEYVPQLTTEEQVWDRFAVTTFYFATEGDSWNECSRSGSSCLSPWLIGDHCDWYSVTCNESGRIESIIFGEQPSV